MISKYPLTFDWTGSLPVLRYAVGSTLILAVALGFDYTLSFITPVLALGFLAPGVAPLSLKAGVGFLLSLALSCLIGVIFSRLFLSFPFVFLPLLALAMLHLYYSNTINPVFKIWLIISLLLIPLLSMDSAKIGGIVAINLVFGAVVAILLVWFIFLLLPYFQTKSLKVTPAKSAESTSDERFQSSMKSLIVILPVVVSFYVFQWSGAILVMIFVVILSMNPQATSFKSGRLIIFANLSGGVAAILAFNLFVIVPEFIFLILITLIVGLYFGNKLFSGKPTAPLYGTAFSTYLLVLGSVTSSDGDAGEKVWIRIFQIGLAVSYVVIAFNLMYHFTQPKKKNVPHYD